MNMPAMGGLMEDCATPGCGHPGFSHDNWDECAECDCDGFRLPEPFDKQDGQTG